MKKLWFSIGFASLFGVAFAGGLQHNSNQSAEYVRMMSRAGSTNGDAVFYNPAGTALFDEGFTISLNNQIPWQTREISSDYSNLQMSSSKGEYEGKVFSPIFPGVYAAYKKSNWTFSLGFNPIGGGGASVFDKGLPMLEIPISTVAQMAGATAYSMDTKIEGYSIYYGFQAGAAYKINDMFSVSFGVRFVDARNSYDGYMNNIQFTTAAGNTVVASTYYSGLAGMTGAVATALAPANAGNPNATLDQLAALNPTLAPQVAAIAGGMPGCDPSTTPVSDIYTYYATASAQASGVAGATQDLSLEVEQHGTGWTPILGFNFHHDKLNIGVKYEFKTKIMLENDTKKDVIIGGQGMFPDGAKMRSDLPALLTVGAEYMLLPSLRLSASGIYYFDKDADYGPARSYNIDENSWEVSFGAEYGITEKIFVSAGYQYTKYNVNDAYLTDLVQALSNHTVGFGGAYKFNKLVKLNLGALYTMNEDRTVPQSTSIPGLGTLNYNTTYGRHTFAIAFGVDLTF